MKKQLTGIGAVLALIGANYAHAQTPEELLRYTRSSNFGTARSVGIGGAMTGLGGDLGNLGGNPAGLGLLRSNVFAITPGLGFTTTRSSNFAPGAESERNSRNQFGFDQGAVAFVTPLRPAFSKNTTGWQSLTIAFGYQKQDMYANYLTATGDNRKNSFLDVFTSEANTTQLNDFDALDANFPFSASIAQQAFLVYDGRNGQYINDTRGLGGMRQELTNQTRGNRGEYSFAVAGNYGQTLTLGASVNVSSMRYRWNSSFSETDVADSIDVLKSFLFSQTLESRGTGINVRLGAQVRAAEWLRIGASIETPTYMRVKEDYATDITSSFDSGSGLAPTTTIFSPENSFAYNQTTPLKAMVGAAFLWQGKGFVSADLDFVDYSTMSVNANDARQWSDTTSRNIARTFGSTLNYRIGAEYNVKEGLYLRGGYAFYGSPFESNFRSRDKELAFQVFSAGVGTRLAENGFLEFTLAHERRREVVVPYSLGSEEFVYTNNDLARNRLLITIGSRF